MMLSEDLGLGEVIVVGGSKLMKHMLMRECPGQSADSLYVAHPASYH